MVWEEPLMTASKGQQQNKTLKTAIINHELRPTT
jgi:hypothetical protein